MINRAWNVSDILYTKQIKLLVYTLFISVAVLISASCSNVASVLNLDADLEMNVTAKADMNPDDSDLASPLVIRLYELKDKKKFEEIEFYDIYANDLKILGKNMIDKHRLKHFVPDTKRKKMFVLNKKTKFIGIFAEFSQYKNSQFRAVVEIDPHFDRKIDIVISGTNLKVDDDKREPVFELESTDEDEKDLKKFKSIKEGLPGA